MDDDVQAIVWLSVRIGLIAVLIALPLAYALAHLLARRDFPGKFLVDALVHLPLVMPPVVTGYALLLLFGRTGPLGQLLDALGMTVLFHWTGAAIASAIMALPLMVRAIRLSIEAIDRRLETAARTLGANRRRVFATITLPLALPGVLAACVLGFARALGEFGATITFVSNIPGQTRTLPIAIYGLLQQPGGEAMALRLSLLSIALSLIALIVAEWMLRRRKVFTDA